MMPVKIECECGQHYAFDIEPVNGRMPAPIACPGCGADGTPAANDVIARALTGIPAPEEPKLIIPPKPVPNLHLAHASPAPEPAPASTPAPTFQSSLHLASHEPAPAQPSASGADAIRAKGVLHAQQFGLVSREQAEIDAKAKILWGETPEEVIKYLMLQSFTAQEAKEMVDELVKVRLADIRANGTRKAVIGGIMLGVTVAAFSASLAFHYVNIRILGAAVAVGVFGFVKLIQGILMIVTPKMESGDVAAD